MVENLLDLLGFELDFAGFYITSVRSGGSSFGEENPPLDPLALGIGHGNPKLTDGSVNSS